MTSQVYLDGAIVGHLTPTTDGWTVSHTATGLDGTVHASVHDAAHAVMVAAWTAAQAVTA